MGYGHTGRTFRSLEIYLCLVLDDWLTLREAMSTVVLRCEGGFVVSFFPPFHSFFPSSLSPLSLSFKNNFISGCAGSLLLHRPFCSAREGFQLWQASFSLRWLFLLQNTGSRVLGPQGCGMWAQELRLPGSRAQAQ